MSIGKTGVQITMPAFRQASSQLANAIFFEFYFYNNVLKKYSGIHSTVNQRHRFLKMKIFRNLLNALKKFLILDRRPPPEIDGINVQRLFTMMCILAPLHLAIGLIFLNTLIADTAYIADTAHQWRMGIIIAHGVMLFLSVAAGILAHKIRGKGLENSIYGRVLVMATAFSYLLFGTVLCVIDQIVTANITPYLITSVAVALLIIMPPHLSALFYGAAYLVFSVSLPQGQSNTDLLLSLQVNGISATVIGLGISVIIWRTHSINIIQKHLIRKQTQEMEEKNRLLEHMAGTDMLTGLYNRMRFIELLEREIARIKRTREESCLIIMDLDHFKAVNDKYGHPGGDTALKLTARAIRGQLRESDILARFGGEEFTLLLPGTSLNGACKAAEKIRHAIETLSFPDPMKDLHMTASFGLALLNDHVNSFDTAYQEADKALYQAKNSGRNRVDYIGRISE